MYKLNAIYFILAFVVGAAIVYFMDPPKVVVYKFPNPWNYDQVYKDRNNLCYKYNAKRTACPKDTSKIESQPVMEDFRNKKEGMTDDVKIVHFDESANKVHMI
jgi:hypothetical protein